ncbi:glycosyltransferase family 2 protein [Lactobacillus sp. PV034]|uniref:glycosyltransferase family 2 protein n=1 Tax=Lactobacillus sp. PV034 TaxID=2594495 RepID=UPI00223F8AD0|nr:glycosyltransferase family 2 protein [Lactobacillus sp. PV034]QNQ81048.1 glycosyltransferase family 2 protein [Lactobacillus sp. PV034]
MLRQPLLTVIMPVYNMEKYLGRALDHLAIQKDKNFKLLIINDGSSDRTHEIAESYRDKFRFFKIVDKPNGGLSDARNLGMSLVDTPYFTFHDGDDWVDPGYTEFFVDAFAKHPEVAMVSCGFWIDSQRHHSSRAVDKKKENGLLSKRDTYLKMTNIFSSPVKGYTWNKGYRTEVVRKYNLDFVKNLAFMEDQIFNVKYVALTDGYYFTSKPLYHYWQRADSMVHTIDLKKVPDNFKANYRVWSQIIKSLLAERDKNKSNKKAAKKAALSDGNYKN